MQAKAEAEKPASSTNGKKAPAKKKASNPKTSKPTLSAGMKEQARQFARQVLGAELLKNDAYRLAVMLLSISELTGYQASMRGGTVWVRVRAPRVILGGQAVTVLIGKLSSTFPPVVHIRLKNRFPYGPMPNRVTGSALEEVDAELSFDKLAKISAVVHPIRPISIRIWIHNGMGVSFQRSWITRSNSERQ